MCFILWRMMKSAIHLVVLPILVGVIAAAAAAVLPTTGQSSLMPSMADTTTEPLATVHVKDEDIEKGKLRPLPHHNIITVEPNWGKEGSRIHHSLNVLLWFDESVTPEYIAQTTMTVSSDWNEWVRVVPYDNLENVHSEHFRLGKNKGVPMDTGAVVDGRFLATNILVPFNDSTFPYAGHIRFFDGEGRQYAQFYYVIRSPDYRVTLGKVEEVHGGYRIYFDKRVEEYPSRITRQKSLGMGNHLRTIRFYESSSKCIRIDADGNCYVRSRGYLYYMPDREVNRQIRVYRMSDSSWFNINI